MAATTSSSDRGSALRALTPLTFDVVVPVVVYYLLSGLGVGNTPALLVGGAAPFGRAIRSIVRDGTAEYLALMVAALFLSSLVLVAFTGSPRSCSQRSRSAPRWSVHGASAAPGHGGR